MDLGYLMFMAEAEGDTNICQTRTARINAFINDIVFAAHKGRDINGEYQTFLLKKYSLQDISLEEEAFIKKEVEKRL